MPKFVPSRIFLLLALFALGMGRVKAQSEDWQKIDFERKIEAVKTFPLEVLPASDCRLADLEHAVFSTYAVQHRSVPSDLKYVLEQKRKQIDFMRSHIDSLYYIQALHAINQGVPDWKVAADLLEKSLMHNRFFVKSISLKITCLLRDKSNAKPLLAYMNAVLRECSFPPKIRQMSQTIYHSLLDEAQNLIDHRQYQDALDLCALVKTYCEPKFPLRYLPYQEKLLVNLAHQGVYRSYCEVAEKAYTQKQYRLSQQYALQAFDYFSAHEKHMNGINRALDLLDRIANHYNHVAALSDYDEQAFYLAMVDTIVRRTGLVIYVKPVYKPEAELASELAVLNTKTEVVPAPKPIDTFKVLSIEVEKSKNETAAPVRLSNAQAKKQFDQACEQARYLKSKRKFSESYQWYEQAALLKEQYRLSSDADFEEECRSTLAQAVEQLCNKAVFHLWNNNTSLADSLYAQAKNFFETYHRKNPQDNAFITQLQQIPDGYLQKRSESNCRELQKNFQAAQADFYRQASFGNHASAAKILQQAEGLHARYQQIEFSSCTPDRAALRNMKKLMSDWNRHQENLQAAMNNLQAGDTLTFIRQYLRADKLFSELNLEAAIPAQPSLFSRLSASGDLRSLLVWAELCAKEQDWEQARFIANYLNQQNHRSDRLNKLNRTLRRAHE